MQYIYIYITLGVLLKPICPRLPSQLQLPSCFLHPLENDCLHRMVSRRDRAPIPLLSHCPAHWLSPLARGRMELDDPKTMYMLTFMLTLLTFPLNLHERRNAVRPSAFSEHKVLTLLTTQSLCEVYHTANRSTHTLSSQSGRVFSHLGSD